MSSGIIPKKKWSIERAAAAELDSPIVTPEERTKQLQVAAQFDRVLSAVRDALTPERFLGSIRTPASTMLRDTAMTIQTLHNPGANPVTVTLSLDAGGEPLFATTLAAGATLTLLGLPFPRLAGFVSTGIVLFAGELPTD